MNVEIYRVDPELPLPQYHSSGAFAFDFLVRRGQTIAPGETALLPANLILKCPQDLALLILPRSSLARKKNLLIPNSPGLIDADFCGEKDEIHIQVLNFSSRPVKVERGERIAQGLFVKTEKINFKEIKSPEAVSRGGFGSTG